ncbi:hypothetical protein COV81_00685 [Candidatus Peregrinibacteria bacterium CG11_big_fil_rev_8_21_14_0_20_41_10]|nr:MAG: hypothetical protein COV81_00685 [Candidatus Peregrinibacteria bacterium CG11_big_fil_rev_8_21_14_0_20_41_10]PJC37566.1 MAG: hypothetical protein CO045_04820 [Candidatus Peregrinibacteria bacterium CG_4_9_14_0_2_um_filter_41_14]
MKKILHISIAVFFIFSTLLVTGCKKQQPGPPKPQVTLNYYRLFDDSDTMTPIIKAFEKEYPNITINYKKFTNVQELADLVVNEIAEDGGPDLFSLPNTWVKSNYKKITPAPSDLIPTEAYQNTFLDIAIQDLIYGTGEKNAPQIYGIPLSIDTLALYYNKDHFEKQLPERGKPGGTWAQLEQDIIKLRRISNNNILQAGLALGRADNVNSAIDIFYALLLQNGVDFYHNNNKTATFANTPATKVANYFTSFAKVGTPYYTWTKDFIAPNQEDQIDKFAKGEISMMFGYSHLYQDVINRIQIAKQNSKPAIELTDVRIANFPQLSTDPNDQLAYSHYLVETVSRTSKHPREAWAFLRFLVNQQNLQTFYKKAGFKPTSRRDLIETQRENAIYRPFIEQLGYATSIPLVDDFKFQQIFTNAITKINNGASTSDILKQAQQDINQLIPSDGVEPPQAKL